MTFDTTTETTSTTHTDTSASNDELKARPDMVEWIQKQKASGLTTLDMFDKLIKANWEPARARRILDLPVQPGPDLTRMSGSIDLGDCRAHVLLSMELPRVVLFANVLSDYECEAMIACARARGLERSQVVNNEGDGNKERVIVHPGRTSEGVYFDRGANELIQRLETRIARLLNWPVDHGEGIQVLHYGDGNEYKPHHDYFSTTSAAGLRSQERGGQRVATLIMYLADTEAGGATVFPKSKLSILPRRGNALFFGYDRPDPATLTLHGGAPVLAGEKWIATKWLRERPRV